MDTAVYKNIPLPFLPFIFCFLLLGGDQPSEKASPSPKKAEKDAEVPEDNVTEDKTEEEAPVKGRRTRGSPRAAAVPKTPPSRRSGRGAAKVATEKIGEQAAGEGPAAEEEDEEPLEATSPSPRRGRKRKSADLGQGSPLKRQKTMEDDSGKSEEQSMETEEPVVQGSGEEDPKGDVEMKTAEPTDVNVEPAQPQEDAVGKTAEPSEQASMKPAEPQEDAKTEAAGPSEEAKMEATGPKEEAKGEEPRRPVGEAVGPSAEEASGPSAQEASEPSVEEASGPSAEEASGPSAVEASGPTVEDTASEDILKDFVVVNKDEMPASDSPAIAAALPKQQDPKEASPQKRVVEAPRAVPAVVVTAPQPSAPAVEEPAPVVPQALPPAQVAQTSVAPSNGDTSDASTRQAAPVTASSVNSNHAVHPAPVANNLSAPPLSNDDLFTREFVRNKSLVGAVDSTKLFSVASYNVLAECHALRCAKDGSYAWMSADNLLTEARHKRLLEEFTYLDADIVCLQEVGRDYFSSTLQPAFLK